MNAKRTVSFGEHFSSWPAAERENSLIGTVWRRREPENDGYDHVSVVGISEGGEIVDLVIAPVEFGEAVSVDPEQLATEFTRVRDDSSDRLAGLDSRLAALAGS